MRKQQMMTEAFSLFATRRKFNYRYNKDIKKSPVKISSGLNSRCTSKLVCSLFQDVRRDQILAVLHPAFNLDRITVPDAFFEFTDGETNVAVTAYN